MFSFQHNSDKQIVKQVLAGDRSAFRILVERYSRFVQGVAYAHLGNHADAEDVCQDTFLRTFESLARLCDTTHLGGWLATVARNRCYDVVRRRLRENALTEQAQSQAGEADGAADREDARRLVTKHLAAMDEEAREILVLNYFMHKKVREIATALGISHAAAAKRLQRARDVLGRRLVGALGDELGREEPPKPNTERIMALILTLSSPWDSVPVSAATAEATVAVVTTAGATLATKLLGLTALIIIAVIALFSLRPGWLGPAADHAPLAEDTGPQTAAPQPDTGPQEGPTGGESSESEESAPAAETGRQDTIYEVEAGIVYGRVVDATGVPVEGAAVLLERRFRSFENRLDLLKQPAGLKTTTDAIGRFRFERVPMVVREPMFTSAHWYRLSALKNGMFTEMDGLYLKDNPMCFVELTLRPPAFVEGVVVDENDQPLGGAEVWPTAAAGLWINIPIRDSRKARTDGNGRFRIDWLPPGLCLLAAGAEGYATQVAPDWVYTGAEGVRVKLRRPGSIAGKVVEKWAQEPVPGVTVIAQRMAPIEEAPPEEWRVSRAVTDDSGAFMFRSLIPATYTLKLDRGTFALSDNSPELELRSGEQASGVVMTVVQGGIVTGRVYDQATGEGLAGQPIAIHAMSGSVDWAVQTDAGGYYRTEGLPEGSFHILLIREDDNGPYCATFWRTITIVSGRVCEGIDFEVHWGVPISGVVVDSTGNPLPDAFVVASPEGTKRPVTDINAPRGGAPFQCHWTVSRDNGSFDINWEKAGGDVYLQARHQTGISEKVGPYRVAEEGLRDVVLAVDAGGNIEGVVVDTRGKPLSRVCVRAQPESAESESLTTERSVSSDSPGYMGGSLETMTQTSGGFYLGPLLPDTYTVTAYGSGSARAGISVRVNPGETVEGVRLALAVPGGAFEGTVFLAGKPLRGARIDVMEDGFLPTTTTVGSTSSDETGHYRIEDIPVGAMLLRATCTSQARYVVSRSIAHPDIASSDETEGLAVENGKTTTVDFDFAAGDAGIEGVVLVNGRPGPGIGIVVQATSLPWDESVRLETDTEGYYRITDLLPEEYTVSVVRKYGPRQTLRAERRVCVEATSGQIVRLGFSVGSSVIEGTVAGRSEEEAVGIYVFSGEITLETPTFETLRDLEKRSVSRSAFQKQNMFRVETLGSGLYTVLAVAIRKDTGDMPEARQSIRSTSVPAEVGDGQTTYLDLTLP